jgi:hypothetical protein
MFRLGIELIARYAWLTRCKPVPEVCKLRLNLSLLELLSHRNPIYPRILYSCLSLDEPVRSLIPPFLVEIQYP